MSKFNKYKLGRLIPLETRAMELPRTMRYNIFMKQATLISVIEDLNKIRLKRRIIKDLDIIAKQRIAKQQKEVHEIVCCVHTIAVKRPYIYETH